MVPNIPNLHAVIRFQIFLRNPNNLLTLNLPWQRTSNVDRFNKRKYLKEQEADEQM